MSDVISVIIPVYNREQYIGRCIESVIQQSYTNIEVIIIDDGSEDGTGEVCKRYCEHDRRIKYVKKKNEGSGYARNAGMDMAAGKYIFFVDSDDYISQNCLEILRSTAEEQDADIVQCRSVNGEEEDFFEKNKREWKEKTKLFSAEEAFWERKINISVWGKLYASSLLRDIRYPRETLFDDEFFTYKCIYRADRIALSDTPLYYIFLSQKSIMRTRKENIPVDICMRAYRERIDFFKREGNEELVWISYRELAIRLMLFYMEAENYRDGTDRRPEILENFNTAYDWGKHYIYGIRERIALTGFHMAPKVVCGIARMVMR